MDARITTEKRTLDYPRDLCDPKGWLNFVQLDPFPPSWKRLGLTDDDLRALEILIMVQPLAPVVSGTGGLRKIRFAPQSWTTGKSGAVRVGYVYFADFGLAALVYAYSKDDKDDLTSADKKNIKALISEIGRYLAGKKSKERRE